MPAGLCKEGEHASSSKDEVVSRKAKVGQAVAVAVHDVHKQKQQQRDPRLRKRKTEPPILLLADATLPVPAKGMKRVSDFSMCQCKTR